MFGVTLTINSYYKYIGICWLLLLFTGCMSLPQNNLVFQHEENISYDEIINKIDSRFKKCFNGEYTMVDIYVIRENYKNPKYTKFVLYIDNQIPEYFKVLGTITVFEKNKKAEVYINQSLTQYRDINTWYQNNMECKNEE